MSKSSEDSGVVTVLLQRLETQRLPRALALKDKVDRGELLNSFDLGFLEEVFAETNSIRPLLAQHPEYQELAARDAPLQGDHGQGLENEKESR
jgi:hypothetical protein